MLGPHALPIIVSEHSSFSRDELVSYLEKNQIETRHLFSSMPTQCAGFSFLGYTLGDFPNAEYCGDHGLHIGVHQDLSIEHIDYVEHIIKQFIRNYTGSR